MNITVINGTEKHGVTYRLKEMFLAEFKDRASITEYDLPKDCPNFCNGCVSCIIKGESTCKDAEYIGRMDRSLLQADLIVMTSPAICISHYGSNESASRSFCLPLDSSPSCPRDVWKAGSDYYAVLRCGGKICGKGYQAQFILVGNF